MVFLGVKRRRLHSWSSQGAGQGLGIGSPHFCKGPRPAETHTSQNQGFAEETWAGMGTQDRACAAPCLPHTVLSTQDGPSSP